MGARVGTPVAVELRTTDASRARAFYGPLLGWRFAAGSGAIDCLVDGAVVASVRPDGTDPGEWRVVFADDEAATVVERVEGAGGSVLRAASEAEGEVVDVADPLGATLAVVDAARREALAPGRARPSWFEIMTSDADATDRFYRSLFGYRIEGPGGPAAPDDPFALLWTGDRQIGGRLALPPELGGLLGDRWMLYFAMPDVDDVIPRAVELGAAVLVPPRDAPTGRVAALRDPVGAIFTIMTPAAPV